MKTFSFERKRNQDIHYFRERILPDMKVLFLPLFLITTFSFCSAQRIFRSPADSVKYFQLQQEIATAIRDNNELAVENLVTKAESYIVKVIPVYEEGQYTFYKDLLKTDRPDTIKRLGLYALNLRKLPEKVYQCTNLQELDIAACKIKTIPEELNQLQSLERIIIAKSNLKKVRIGIKENYTVKEINLAFNNFRKKRCTIRLTLPKMDMKRSSVVMTWWSPAR